VDERSLRLHRLLRSPCPRRHLPRAADGRRADGELAGSL